MAASTRRRGPPKAVIHQVRQLRAKLQISQEELAARAELHRNYIGSVEKGSCSVAKPSNSRWASSNQPSASATSKDG